MKKSFKEIFNCIQENFGTDFGKILNENSLMPQLLIEENQLLNLANFLYSNELMYFDLLECVTAIDNGIEANTIDMVYNFYSIPYDQKICVKVILERQNAAIESLSTIWRTANWHEREAFDLVGVHFKNHSDLRRILNPEDWQGHPLRKDYKVQEFYHDIKVEY